MNVARYLKVLRKRVTDTTVSEMPLIVKSMTYSVCIAGAMTTLLTQVIARSEKLDSTGSMCGLSG